MTEGGALFNITAPDYNKRGPPQTQGSYGTSTGELRKATGELRKKPRGATEETTGDLRKLYRGAKEGVPWILLENQS